MVQPASRRLVTEESLVKGPAWDALQPGLSASYAQVAARPVNLREAAPGIDWTGATDSAAALQAVLTDNPGAKIEFGRSGVVRCDSTLTMSTFQHLEGPLFQMAANPAPVRLDFSNLPAGATGIQGGVNVVLKSFLLAGPGYAANGQIGFASSEGAPQFERMQFHHWPIGTKLTTSYYTTADQCEWRTNKSGFESVGCTNLTFIAPRFQCDNESRTAQGTGLTLDTDNYPVRVFGGSFESYKVGIQLGVRSQLSLFGTYFESVAASMELPPIGIQGNSVAGAMLELYGCGVYMQEHNCWVSMGDGAKSNLIARGNKFVATTASSTTPVAYSLAGTGTGLLTADLSGDNWAGVTKGTYYAGTATLPRAGFSVAPPTGATNAGLHYIGDTVLNRAWTSYTPTWSSSGTSPAIGNGSFSRSKYLQDGKIVRFQIGVVPGSTTTFGTGTYTFSLPVTAATAPPSGAFAVKALIGGVDYAGTATQTTKDAVVVYFGSTLMTATAPGTFANGDWIIINGEYESA